MNMLLLNGAKHFGHSDGKLNHTLHNEAVKILTDLEHTVRQTIIDDGYDVEDEIEKFLWMDVVIWQMPAWWMGEPWTVKKYIDEVFTQGHGRLYKSDGRHEADPTKGYGTGGLLYGKHHMLCVTWNAPIEAFYDKTEFFNGVGVDMVYLHFHKIHEFMGIKPLKTFMCNDVVKNPHIPNFISSYKDHLKSLFEKKHK